MRWVSVGRTHDTPWSSRHQECGAAGLTTLDMRTRRWKGSRGEVRTFFMFVGNELSVSLREHEVRVLKKKNRTGGKESRKSMGHAWRRERHCQNCSSQQALRKSTCMQAQWKACSTNEMTAWQTWKWLRLFFSGCKTFFSTLSVHARRRPCPVVHTTTLSVLLGK